MLNQKQVVNFIDKHFLEELRESFYYINPKVVHDLVITASIGIVLIRKLRNSILAACHDISVNK